MGIVLNPLKMLIKMNVKIKKKFELFSMVSKIVFKNINDSDKDLRNEILAFLATKQSVIQVRMRNTDLGQSAN